METVFGAIADPTRRALLDRLREAAPRGLSLGELARGLPMSRQAVTKHLDALRRAGLITVRREGRERLHDLDAAPLTAVDDFLAPYEAFWDARLTALRRHLGEDDR
jgi:DNA-binding transcriptional ArsR family regulator